MPPKIAGSTVISEKNHPRIRFMLGDGCPQVTIHARFLTKHFKGLEAFIETVSAGSEDEDPKIKIDVPRVREFLRNATKEEPLKVLAMVKDVKNNGTSEA